MLCALCVYASRHFDRKGADTVIGLLLCNTLLLLHDMILWALQGQEGMTAYFMVRISAFTEVFLRFAILAVSAQYLTYLAGKRSGNPPVVLRNIIYGFCISAGLLSVGSCFSHYFYYVDKENVYHVGKSLWVEYVIGFSCLALLGIMVFRYWKFWNVFERYAYAVCLCVTVAGGLAQALIGGVSFICLASAVCMLLLFLVYEMQFADVMVERESELNREKRSLLEEQVKRKEESIRLFQKQIQPHFIFNCLLIIRDLCHDNPEASEVVTHFTKYLRDSVDILEETACIPAERELGIVENYLYMEKKRFGDKIRSEFIVEDQDFLLPAFTIETLVENAVRHGIRKTEDGRGTVNVHVYREDGYHVIEVTDDGAGFSKEWLEENAEGEKRAQSEESGVEREEKRVHVGLKNVRARLELMCDGELMVESEVGKGTKAVVRIPELVR